MPTLWKTTASLMARVPLKTLVAPYANLLMGDSVALMVDSIENDTTEVTTSSDKRHKAVVSL